MKRALPRFALATVAAVVGITGLAASPAMADPLIAPDGRNVMTTPLSDWTPPDEFPASPAPAVAVPKGAVDVLQTSAVPASAVCNPLRQCITATATSEKNNSSRNREGTGNCNYYSGYWLTSGSASSACPTTSGVKWRQNAWCADFARFVWHVNGAVTTGLDPWAGSFYRATVGTSRWKPKSSGYIPQPGDAVVFDWDGQNGGTNGWGIDHVGIVISYNTSTGQLTTIEGNTTASGNGGTEGVYQRNRATTSVVGYVVPQAGSGPIFE